MVTRRALPVSAGELDQMIDLLTKVKTEDEVGQTGDEWADLSTGVYARARPLTGREFFRSGMTQVDAPVVFAIRYRAGLDATMGVRWQGRHYDVIGVPIDVDGGRHTLELTCNGGRPGAPTTP